MDIKINPDSYIPIYRQIVDDIISQISSGKLNTGEKLPSIRNLSGKLNVNKETVVRAYKKLEKLGVIRTHRGRRSEIIDLPRETKNETLVDLYSNFLMEAKKMGYNEKEVIDTVTQHSLNSILAIDVGSTTTKAILFRRNSNGEMIFSGLHQAATTVESEDKGDVWTGIENAIRGLEDRTDWSILSNGELITPSTSDGGIDIFLATSSAGGGLQMVTVGLVSEYTARSSERTALGAGAIVMDVLALNDKRTPYEKVLAMKGLKPDIILLSGGTEGGAISGVVELGEILASSEIKGKFGDYNIPLVYAGNSAGVEFVKRALSGRFDLYIAENIRPDLKTENYLPARKEILKIFMEHVMKRAPGYRKLIDRVSSPVLPTPGAIFGLVRKYAEDREKNIIAFDIGGATTDVFSAYENVVVRTVSANLGMSYSLLQSIKRSGTEKILRRMPMDIERSKLKNISANKMISPTSLPETDEEREMELAVAKEIVNLSLEDHRRLAKRKYNEEKMSPDTLLKGEKRVREMHAGQTELEPLNIDMLIGSGGMLAHRSRSESLEILLDGFPSTGVTELYVDSAFMMPHLGVLSSQKPALALDLLERECLIPLATVISASGSGKEGDTAFTIKVEGMEKDIEVGSLLKIPVKAETVKILVEPAGNFDMGNGRGVAVEKVVKSGKFGIICDQRIETMKINAKDVKRWRKIITGGTDGKN